MQTSLAPFIRDTARGQEAERILRTCVHCGFCNATCPTYQLLGDELDGPRGRIYLIKQMLEGQPASARTLDHLDRCLTCRACESTCPSGVEYAKLADIGRQVAEHSVGRHWLDRLRRWALRKIFPHAAAVRVVFWGARRLAPLLPPGLREQVPGAPTPARSPVDRRPPPEASARAMLLLEGCVQAAASPATNRAASAVLRAQGIEARIERRAGCCGAIAHHLGAHAQGLNAMRRNIDAWWPHIETGVEAIVSTASGCGAVLKDYGYLLREDSQYAERAAAVSALTRDLSEVLDAAALGAVCAPQAAAPVAFHPPCSLQHALRLGGTVERLLTAAGIELTALRDSHLCCGSAGTYSLLQPKLSEQLLERKLAAIAAGGPSEIVTANIGCQLHLARRAGVPVRHWVELVAERLDGQSTAHAFEAQ